MKIKIKLATEQLLNPVVFRTNETLNKMRTSLIILSLLTATIGYANRGVTEYENVSESLKSRKIQRSDYILTGTQNVLNWVGSKPGSQHHGTVIITEGKISLSGNVLTAGNFKFDLNSIIDLDLENPGMNAKLVRHLKSSDFFDAEKFPVASFEIVSVKSMKSTNELKEGEVVTNSEVTGNLTIKGITKSIVFPARIIIEKNKVSVTTNPFTINRTLWGVNYQSKSIIAELKDKFIYDEIVLSFNLNFNKV